MLDFLRSQKKGGETLLLSSRINTVQKLRHLLLKADRVLERHDEEVRRGGRLLDVKSVCFSSFFLGC